MECFSGHPHGNLKQTFESFPGIFWNSSIRINFIQQSLTKIWYILFITYRISYLTPLMFIFGSSIVRLSFNIYVLRLHITLYSWRHSLRTYSSNWNEKENYNSTEWNNSTNVVCQLLLCVMCIWNTSEFACFKTSFDTTFAH